MTSPSDRDLAALDEEIEREERKEGVAIANYRMAAIELTARPSGENFNRSMAAHHALEATQRGLLDLYHQRKHLIDGVDRSPAGEDTDVARATELFEAIIRRGAPGDEAHGSDPANFRPWAIARIVQEFRRSRKSP